MSRVALATLGLLGALCVLPAWAQMGAVPPEVADGVRQAGRVIDPSRTARLYGPLHEREPYAGVRVTRDIRYGAADRHRLDVFAPEAGGGAPRPLLVFVHGGAFVGGNKRAPGSPFYDNIAVWAARHGLVGVNITYRLAPAHPWPAGAEDVAAALRWAAQNAAAHGGDATRVFAMGHSAGAVHVASYLAHAGLHRPDGPGLAGAVLVSGLYDLTTLAVSPVIAAYYGEDTARYAERSPLAGLLRARVPLLVALGELDPPDFERQSAQVREALCKAGRCPRYLVLPGHSHMSEVYAINTRDTLLTGAILDLVRAGR